MLDLKKIWLKGEEVKNYLHAQFCYQFFITPLPLPIDKEYREFARQACEFLKNNRTELIERTTPRHYVLHHFAQPNNPGARKVLVNHGWMSRAAYMARIIHTLHQQGYEVYALDFPAHGEARGWQLPWYDAVAIVRSTLNDFGPFYAAVGHSFGGAMLLNTLNLSHQLPDWQLEHELTRAVMIASPTSMRTPVSRVARRFHLSADGFVLLRDCFKNYSQLDINYLNYRRLAKGATTPILCIHGEKDETIKPIESIVLAREYPHAELALLPDGDHVSVLMDTRVEERILQFLS